MKTLHIHKYYTRSRSGGSITAFFQTLQLLKKKGQSVITFSMRHPQSEPSAYADYFADYFDINRTSGIWQKIHYALKSIYNLEAQRKLQALIEKERPAVAHVHDIYHYLTPSILHTLKKNQIPIVMKLSDYKLICPNYKLFRNGKICQQCKTGKYYYCFLNRCLKNSFSVSLVAMIEAYVHRFLGSYDLVDYFLAPSEFMKQKCVEFGVAPERIKILRNVMNLENFQLISPELKKEYFVYFGRLAEEKGLEDLIMALKILKDKKQLAFAKLLLAGEGPEEEKLKELVLNLNLQKEVEFLGFRQGAKLFEIVGQALFSVLPSVWFDNSPVTISESCILGTPVLVSNLGGSKEMLEDGKTGLLFKAGDVQDLADKIKQLLDMDQEERQAMAQKAREYIIKLNNEEEYYQKLMSFYQSAINNHQQQ